MLHVVRHVVFTFIQLHQLFALIRSHTDDTSAVTNPKTIQKNQIYSIIENKDVMDQIN